MVTIAKNELLAIVCKIVKLILNTFIYFLLYINKGIVIYLTIQIHIITIHHL